MQLNHKYVIIMSCISVKIGSTTLIVLMQFLPQINSRKLGSNHPFVALNGTIGISNLRKIIWQKQKRKESMMRVVSRF